MKEIRLQGQEDLRLEERLLQMTLLISGVLQHDPQVQARRLSIRRFAVTPLGPRVGLIEWVENTRPLFQIVNSCQKQAADRAALARPEQGKSLIQAQAGRNLCQERPF